MSQISKNIRFPECLKDSTYRKYNFMTTLYVRHDVKHYKRSQIGQVYRKISSVGWYAENITQLRRLKVKLQGHAIYNVISCPLHISLTLERFSFNFTQMFLLLRRCTETMTQLCRLKVILQGHMGCTLYFGYLLTLKDFS